MYLRDLAKRKWREAGLYKSKKSSVQSFLKYIEDNPLDCWDESIKVFRKRFYDAFDDLVPPLLDTDDKLMRLIVIRRLNAKNRKELDLLKKLAKDLDAHEHELELKAVALVRNKSVLSVLKSRQDLSMEVRHIFEPIPERHRHATNIVRNAPYEEQRAIK